MQDEEAEAAAAAEADGGVEGERSHRRIVPSALPVANCAGSTGLNARASTQFLCPLKVWRNARSRTRQTRTKLSAEPLQTSAPDGLKQQHLTHPPYDLSSIETLLFEPEPFEPLEPLARSLTFVSPESSATNNAERCHKRNVSSAEPDTSVAPNGWNAQHVTHPVCARSLCVHPSCTRHNIRVPSIEPEHTTSSSSQKAAHVTLLLCSFKLILSRAPSASLSTPAILKSAVD
eukprot:CAMPEP_0179492990 /NCGR_PEP_ID=MMETSP0799-20121207/67149_1 /TAXON_ID=46947 /ORGANISM="Geminigera cryophila, Strain CCMP2564" /LENGTH=231 /DNA_ID=CAMNT_0021310011 /DNA_START=653 /DNA_END=1345 /DNA_ORIENTATION=+